MSGFVYPEPIQKDYFAEVGLGNVPGRSIMRGLGERDSVGATAGGEDIWRGVN